MEDICQGKKEKKGKKRKDGNGKLYKKESNQRPGFIFYSGGGFNFFRTGLNVHRSKKATLP
jgi:hypothetical protein